MNPEKSYLYKKERRQKVDEGVPVFRKKSKTSAVSDSRRRSRHKHRYKKIILHYGSSYFAWGRQCEICGRIDSAYKSANCNSKDFQVTGEDSYGNWEDICLGEIHRKFPEFSIMTLKNAEWEPWTEDISGKDVV